MALFKSIFALSSSDSEEEERAEEVHASTRWQNLSEIKSVSLSNVVVSVPCIIVIRHRLQDSSSEGGQLQRQQQEDQHASPESVGGDNVGIGNDTFGPQLPPHADAALSHQGIISTCV